MIDNNIDALRNERKTLRDELAAYALRAGDVELQKWLKSELRQFMLSLKTMDNAKTKAAEAAEQALTSPESFGEWLTYANKLEQLAIQESELHGAYLNRIIAKMRAKKQKLGLISEASDDPADQQDKN